VPPAVNRGPRQLGQWIIGIGGDGAHGTVSETYRLVAGVFKSAVHNRLIAFDPVDDIRLPRRRRDGDDRIINPADFHSLLLPITVTPGAGPDQATRQRHRDPPVGDDVASETNWESSVRGAVVLTQRGGDYA